MCVCATLPPSPRPSLLVTGGRSERETQTARLGNLLNSQTTLWDGIVMCCSESGSIMRSAHFHTVKDGSVSHTPNWTTTMNPVRDASCRHRASTHGPTLVKKRNSVCPRRPDTPINWSRSESTCPDFEESSVVVLQLRPNLLRKPCRPAQKSVNTEKFAAFLSLQRTVVGYGMDRFERLSSAVTLPMPRLPRWPRRVHVRGLTRHIASKNELQATRQFPLLGTFPNPARSHRPQHEAVKRASASAN